MQFQLAIESIFYKEERIKCLYFKSLGLSEIDLMFEAQMVTSEFINDLKNDMPEPDAETKNIINVYKKQIRTERRDFSIRYQLYLLKLNKKKRSELIKNISKYESDLYKELEKEKHNYINSEEDICIDRIRSIALCLFECDMKMKEFMKVLDA